MVASARAHAGRRRADARAARAHLRAAQRRARARRGRMRTVLMERWDPEAALDLIERERDHVHDRPADVLRRADGRARLLARAGRVAAAGLVGRRGRDARRSSRRPRRRSGAVVKRTYGSTEAPTITTSHCRRPAGARASDTDGRVDRRRRRFGIAADGELLVQGPELFAGYLDADADRGRGHAGAGSTPATSPPSTTGWLTIVGRKKDVIIRGGENIAAAEVERVARGPSRRARGRRGRRARRSSRRTRVRRSSSATRAFDLEECRHWFAEQGVARFKTPERVEHLDRFPTLAAGKVDRTALRRACASDRPDPRLTARANGAGSGGIVRATARTRGLASGPRPRPAGPSPSGRSRPRPR